MKKLLTIFIILLVCVLNVHAQRGRVQIQDGTLVTDSGTLLRGAHFDTHDESLRDSTWITPEDIIGIKNLGLNCIRLFTENPWRGDTAGSRAAFIDSVVTWTRNNSMYLVLVWAGWSPNETTPEDSVAHNFYKGFWNFYAPRYKDETHVIFEICNEPGQVPYSPEVIAMEKESYTIIRSQAPETHILFLTPYHICYDSIVSDIKKLGDDIDWSNASIAGHAYSEPSQDNIEPIEKIKDAGYAITITEFHSFLNEYANLALTRVFEQEQVSYMHFISAKKMMDDPSVYKSRVESSEVRWEPDFGTWPESITEIIYQNPYQYWPAIFYDEGSGWLNDLRYETLEYISNNDYIAYYCLNFEDAPASFEVFCSSDNGEGNIEIHLDSLNGPVVGVCAISNTGGWDIYESFTCVITTPFTGVHRIYLVFKETAGQSLFNVKSWYFGKSDSVAPQTPYLGAASVIPGKIEAEEYDIGGPTISFLDMDTANQGALFRDDDVDIDATGDGGYCVAWTEENEWMEYTVSCEQDTVLEIQLRTACWKSGNKFNIKLDNKKLATVYLDSIGSYHDWSIDTIENILIPAGENQILRIELMDGNFNLDWLNFVASGPNGIDEVKKKNLITFYPNPAQDYISIKSAEPVQVEIYSLQGQLLIRKTISSNDILLPVNNLSSGSYIVKITNRIAVNSEILIIE